MSIHPDLPPVVVRAQKSGNPHISRARSGLVLPAHSAPSPACPLAFDSTTIKMANGRGDAEISRLNRAYSRASS